MWIGGVRVIVKDEENKILMVRQEHEGRNLWMVPGGGIEKGETSAEAAVREVKEETGLDIRIIQMVWQVEQVTKKGQQRFVTYFLAEKTGGTLTVGRDPELSENQQVIRQVAFLSRDEIEKLSRIYPEYLCQEVWRVLEMESPGYDIYKIRSQEKTE